MLRLWEKISPRMWDLSLLLKFFMEQKYLYVENIIYFSKFLQKYTHFNMIYVKSCWFHVEIMLKSCWNHVGIILKACWNHVEIMLKSCWNHIEIMLKSCWNHVEIMLASNTFALVSFGRAAKMYFRHLWHLWHPRAPKACTCIHIHVVGPVSSQKMSTMERFRISVTKPGRSRCQAAIQQPGSHQASQPATQPARQPASQAATQPGSPRP